MLSKYHLNTLKRLQSLPMRTATSAVYLLLGALPMESELHIKRQLSLLYSILVSTNEIIKELTECQIKVNLETPLSYYSRVQNVLDLYQLPSLNELKLKQMAKELWKTTVKEAVNNYWTESLTSEPREKSTLRFLDIDSMKIGQTHPV